jgi:hypothetical protein
MRPSGRFAGNCLKTGPFSATNVGWCGGTIELGQSGRGKGARQSLLVNEIAPYDGTVVAGKDTVVLVIEAEGPWQIEVTVR